MQATSRKSSVRFRERSELLDFLLEVTTATANTLDLDQLLSNVADVVKKVIPYELLAILLYSEKRQDLRIRFAVGHREEVVRNLSIALGEGITGAAAAQREPILVRDVRTDPRYLNALDAVRSELAVPMLARNMLVGVIDVQSTREHAYSEYDRALLRLMASRVASSIDNARLYRRAERQNRTLRTLARISHEFASILELDELLNKIAATIRSLINYDAFSILLVDEQQKVLRHRVSVRHDRRVKIDHVPLGKGLTGAAAESREVVLVDDTSTDPRYIASHPDIRSEVAVPLIVKDRVVGVMDLESDRVAYFTEDHVRTLGLLAPQIAASVENARLYEEVAKRQRRLEEDLKAARELQSWLLPVEPPDLANLELGIGLRPAREISGDIYDFSEHDDEHATLAFGDVSGKGVAAALYGSLMSGLLRTTALRRRNPAALMKALNDALVARKVESRYVTLLLMVWHPHSRLFNMANAGALPPMICREGEILKLRVEGVPLGLLPDRDYEEISFQAQAGDVLVLYSDGVSDHLSPAGEEYGRGRLAKVVREGCSRPAHALVESIFADLDHFNPTLFDDQTLIVLKVK
ncbi:MAG: SpoIIE family protein phosphatase [Acidobacteriia bacterium]|nr:SpoIIE family protein phosphatase [Terriglobia bacterium]